MLSGLGQECVFNEAWFVLDEEIIIYSLGEVGHGLSTLTVKIY